MSSSSAPPGNKQQSNVKWIPSEEIFPSKNWDCTGLTNCLDFERVNLGSETVLQVKPTSVIETVQFDKSKADIPLEEENHPNVICSVYEGGFLNWECIHDLSDFLDSIELQGKSVLDLGCGVGLLGILALKKGASAVYFQEYNKEVLQLSTIPNVQLNDAESISKCRFFSGDWESFANKSDFKCDFLVCSDSIYNPANYEKVHNVIRRTLKPNGVALLASKSNYFGLGGSTKQFKNMVMDKAVFNIEVAWKSSRGAPKEILKLTFK